MRTKRDPRLEREFAIFQKNYGAVVKMLRLKVKLSRAELARRAKVSVSMLANLEQGCGNPTITRMVNISEVLKVRLSRMFEMAQGMKGNP
jgi:transcriptional regulator with XRE-family HTH domain